MQPGGRQQQPQWHPRPRQGQALDEGPTPPWLVALKSAARTAAHPGICCCRLGQMGCGELSVCGGRGAIGTPSRRERGGERGRLPPVGRVARGRGWARRAAVCTGAQGQMGAGCPPYLSGPEVQGGLLCLWGSLQLLARPAQMGSGREVLGRATTRTLAPAAQGPRGRVQVGTPVPAVPSFGPLQSMTLLLTQLCGWEAHGYPRELRTQRQTDCRADLSQSPRYLQQVQCLPHST